MKRVPIHILNRIYLLFGLFLLMGALVCLRAFSLQMQKSFWVQRDQDEKIFFRRNVADRGNILSENGTIMATSLPFYRIAMDPTVPDTLNWPNFNDSLMMLAGNLSNYFGGGEVDTMTYYNRIVEAMRQGDRHVYLTNRVLNFQELDEVRTWPIIKHGRYQAGFIAERIHNRRFYPFDDLASITLGRMSGDTLGIRGIEASFNTELRGRDGYHLVQKVAGDVYIPIDQYGQRESYDGLDVVTTLDVSMQEVVQEALERGVERNFAQYGTAILMEVETGKIKALANYPETYNHAIATKIEPGSTFKLASALAVLEDGLLELCDTVDAGDGVIEYIDQQLTDAVGYGRIPFEKVVAKSSNVGMSKVVNENYANIPDRFLWHLQNFGFFEPANNQIKGEPQPTILQPGDELWNLTTLPSMAIGYSLEVTPIQMAAFYNGIANQGKLIRPWLVKELRNNSRVIREFGPEYINPQMCSPETATKAQEMMRAVVKYGTASRSFRGMPFEVAGKTGTARKTVGKEYVKRYRASFGGFFPANRPRFTLFIMVDDPQAKAITGGEVSAPIFREIAEKVYAMDTLLSVPATDKFSRPGRKPAPRVLHAQHARILFDSLGLATSGAPDSAEWLRTASNRHQINLKSYDPGGRIPNMRGMTTRDAMNMLEDMGVQVILRGTGRVRRQSLLPGYRAGKGTTITLYCG